MGTRSTWSGSCGSGPRCSISCASRARPALAALFEGARPVEIDRDEATLTIGFPAERHLQQAQGRGRRTSASSVAAALEAVTGERLRPVYVRARRARRPRRAPGGEEEIDEEELVERLKSEFDAEEVG